MQHFALEQILQMEPRYRAAFINSLGGFKSICLVGTKNKNAQSNLAIFNSIVHIGAHPPLMGMIVRPDSVERHTYENIVETKCYTLNHIHENIYKQAHQTSARYSREQSEFLACGLNEEYKNNFFAPYVKESHIQIGLELKEEIKIKSNATILIIGEVKHVYFPAGAQNQDGFIDLEQCGSLAGSGLDSYHQTTKIARLAYAKPNTELKTI
jgi:flavin reductase (DIM6/NTAB) family NADH-FMN oxidoreductase RutF